MDKKELLRLLELHTEGTGLFPEVMLAQMMTESGMTRKSKADGGKGLSVLSEKYHNYSGQKASGVTLKNGKEGVDYVIMGTEEDFDSEQEAKDYLKKEKGGNLKVGDTKTVKNDDGTYTVTLGQPFRIFESDEAGVTGHIRFLTGDGYTAGHKANYKQVVEAKTPEAQIEALKSSGYATDQNYVKTLTSVLNNKVRTENPQYSKNPDVKASAIASIEAGEEVGTEEEIATSLSITYEPQVAGWSMTFDKKLTKEDKIAYYDSYGGKMFLNDRLGNIEDGGYENQGVFKDDDQGMIIGYGIDLNSVNTVDLLVEQGVHRADAEKWEKLGILGKTKSELEDEGKALGKLKLSVNVSSTAAFKSDMSIRQSIAIDKKLEKYQGKVSDDVYIALANNLQVNGESSEDGFDSDDKSAREAHASSLVYAAMDKWIAENPDKPVPDKVVHKVFKSNSDSLSDSGDENAADSYFDNAKTLFDSSSAANNYHVREPVVSDYDYSEDGDGATIEALLRRQTAGEELTEEETDYLYNAQLNNHKVFYQATEAAKNTKGIMTDVDIALVKKNANDPDSLTPKEKKALAVINKEADVLEKDLNIEATNDALVRTDETGGLGPAVKATEETAERTEVDTSLVAGDSTAQDDAMRLAKGDADHEARIKQMLKDTDSYNEDGTLITEAQVKAKQDAEDKLNQDKIDAAKSEKKEGQMRKAEMALTGLKAAAGILTLSQALRAPDVETPELDPLIYEALQKQKALSESGLTAKEKGAAMQNMNDAYAGL